MALWKWPIEGWYGRTQKATSLIVPRSSHPGHQHAGSHSSEPRGPEVGAPAATRTVLARSYGCQAWRGGLRLGLFGRPGPVAGPYAHAYQHGCPDRVHGQPLGRRGCQAHSDGIKALGLPARMPRRCCPDRTGSPARPPPEWPRTCPSQCTLYEYLTSETAKPNAAARGPARSLRRGRRPANTRPDFVRMQIGCRASMPAVDRRRRPPPEASPRCRWRTIARNPARVRPPARRRVRYR